MTRAIAERAARPWPGPAVEPVEASVQTRPKRSQRLIGWVVRRYERAPATVVGGTFLLFWATLALVTGPLVAAGVAVIVLCHELGHWVAFRRLRIWSTAPIFLPLTGAFVVTKARARGRRGYAWCVLAGPLFGVVAIAVTVMLADTFDSRLIQSWAVIGARINLLNLLPIPGLDGGLIFRSVRRDARGRGALLLAWIGTALATHVLLVIAFDLFRA